MRWSTAVFIAVSILAEALFAAPVLAADPPPVGTMDVYSGSASNPPGLAQAFRFTASASSDVDQLNVYLDGSNTARSVEIGLYSNTSSGAGRRRGRCVVTSPTPNAWNSCTFSAYTVVKGGQYWLALLHPAGSRGTLKYREAFLSAAPASYASRNTALASLPSSWANGGNWGSYRASVYADLAGSTPPPPSPVQCADGQDNDRDGRTDLNDPGCSSASDNDETDPPPPADADGDGVPDSQDQCPNAPGPASSNGCPTTPPPASSTVYHVSGRNLLDPCGDRVIVRGVEQFFWNEGWLAPSFVTEVAKTGANAMRVIPMIAGNSDGRPAVSLAVVEDLIQRGIQGKMLVDVAINGGKDPTVYLRDDVKALLLRYEKNIVIHAVGEAYESTGLAWATRVKGVISQLRAGGYKAPLYIMSIDGGRNLPAILQYGPEILNADPLKNVVFGWQAYWGQSSYYQNKYGMTLADAMGRVRDAGIPIQVGAAKIGDAIDGLVNYMPILTAAQTYGIGWLWWDWRMSNGNLTTDGVYGHWAPGGQQIAVSDPASIQNTSTRTYFQQNGTCRQAEPPPPPSGGGGLPAGVTLREPDGGTNYFAQFSSNGPLDDPAYFPMWLWGQYDMTNANIGRDKSQNFNGYYGLVDPPSANLPGLAAAGMPVMPDADFFANSAAVNSPAVVGWRLGDEADTLMGPGWDQWDGTFNWNHCIPLNTAGGQCGYTVMRTVNERAPRDGRARIMNYTKGVAFYETNQQAATFVNGPAGTSYTMGQPGGFQDITTMDLYWFTDGDLQDPSQGAEFYNASRRLTFDESHRAYNYALTVDRLRALDALDGRRQPIFGQIEMGWWRNEAPSGGYSLISGPEMRAAFWQSVIAGARGIVYLPFSFAGAPCGTQHHTQRDTSGCYTELQNTATQVNAQARDLALVLNSQFADGYATPSAGINAMAKRGPDGKFYVFAGNKDNSAKTGTFALAGGQGTTATVLGENRSVPISGGRFQDNFADGNAIHIYRID
jgi:hypothetical protein